LERWKSGRWKGGKVAGWKGEKVERWKGRKVERWKVENIITNLCMYIYSFIYIAMKVCIEIIIDSFIYIAINLCM